MTPQEFKAKWSKPLGPERQTYREHFRDLWALLHQPTPSTADRADLDYTFERAVWHAYGWDNDPPETTEDDLLTRLLALNQDRSRKQRTLPNP